MTSTTTGIRIDPGLKTFLPVLTEEELGQLEKNILADPGRVRLLVWKEEGVLLDGHNRYAICRKHNLHYDSNLISLPDLEAAKLWIMNEHLGRRNFSDDQKSYWRAKHQDALKKSTVRNGQGRYAIDAPGCQNDTPVKTAQTVAKLHHVSESTIHRDVRFARAVDTIAANAGEDAKNAILNGDVKMTRQEVQQVAVIAAAQPKAVKNVLTKIKAANKPKETKRIVQEATRQLPKPAVNGSLFPEIKTEKSIESVQLKGGEGFIICDPESNPVFNKTNEMVDWASWTWNPVTGCWHGCDYCYAREIANSPRMAEAYPKQFEPTFHEARLKAPKNTAFPKIIERPADRNVFTCSMADLFGKWVPDDWIAQVFEQVRRNPQWNFLFLTKFPQRLRSVCDDLLKGFPKNAWVGCTVDGQARVKTAQEAFKGLRAKVRWLSVEPMQERLTFGDMTMFDWIVVGGQSASYYNNTPEFQPEWEWVEHLLGQARRAGLKVYFKENLKVKPKEVPWDQPAAHQRQA